MDSRSNYPHSWAWGLLAVLCLVLGVGLFYRHSTGAQERLQYLGRINQLSNAWHEVCLKLKEQKLVNLSLERDLTAAVEDARNCSNRVDTMSAELAQASSAKDTINPLSQPDPRLLQLQQERDGLNAKLQDLTGALAKLDRDMAEVQRRLQASEGDRNALLKELKRLEVEKADLMRQFNDIALVRDQLRKLKAEQSVSRRLEWARRSTFGSYKGAELLRQRLASADSASHNFDLNVEFRQNGGAKEVPARR